MALNNIFNATKKLLTEKEAAAYLGIAPGTLSVWRSTKRYPLAYHKIGRCVRYSMDELEAFAASGVSL